jgi:glycosyltransferase involved in cell wall biosynthesis
MKKILIVMSALDIGGAQRFCLNFCHYLNEIHYDYEVLFLRKSKCDDIRQEFITRKIHFSEFGCSSVMKALPKLVRNLKKNRPDVVLSTIGNVDFTTALAVMVAGHSKLFLRKSNEIFDNQRSLGMKVQLKLQSLVAHRMIALTEEMKEDYLQYGFKADKIVVINNMVDLGYIESRYNYSSEQFDEELFASENIVIANARMVEEKRYDVLIDAFFKLQYKLNNARLIVLGDGPLRKNIEAMVPDKAKDSIVFMGFQKNPYFYMHKADVFVLTSDYEGFPNVIIEAFACGLPVVSTNCKTGPKEIIDEGVTGYIVPVHDAEALSERLYQILTNADCRKLLAVAASKKVREYSIEKIAAQYIEVFENT